MNIAVVVIIIMACVFGLFIIGRCVVRKTTSYAETKK